MTVEHNVEAWDQFPIGTRVLAVDDDQTCLRILETLLHHCRYHVTTTNQAQTALFLLRDNKNKFDLVISDVDMPDMDGFKLLEHVGLEMDLPVIMLSAHSDPKYVMKGITHGACDYLLKPVRIEELKNIWQHVVRRKKLDKNCGNNVEEKDGSGNASGNESAGNSDQSNMKFNRKRKDQYEDEEDEKDENERDSEDSSAQKKPRVVWTIELHKKFVAAVNHLGIDKAVPKKILDLMNVEKLTRENVASHLQKYRLYLKRISCVANQQADMAAMLGSTDTRFLQMSSPLNGLGGFHRTMAPGSGQFQGGAAMRSFPLNGMIGRFNSPAGLSVRNLSASGMFPRTQTDIRKLVQVSSLPLSTTNGGNSLQGLPMPVELDQLHTHNNNSSNNKGITGSPVTFPSFPTQESLFSDVPNSLLVLEGHSQQPSPRGTSLNSGQGPLISNVPNSLLVLEGHPQQPSPTGTSLNSGLSPHFSGDQISRRLEHWPSAVSSTFLPADIGRNVVSTTPSQNGNSTNQFNVSSLSSFGHPVHLQHSQADTQEWNAQNNYSLNYQIPVCHSSVSLGQSLDPSSTTLCRSTDFDPNMQPDFFDPLQPDIVGPTTDALLINNTDEEGFFMGQQKPEDGFMDAGCLDDIVNSTMKQDQNQS